MTPKNNSRIINVLGVAMLLNTLNTPALSSTKRTSEDIRRFNMIASY